MTLQPLKKVVNDNHGVISQIYNLGIVRDVHAVIKFFKLSELKEIFYYKFYVTKNGAGNVCVYASDDFHGSELKHNLQENNVSVPGVDNPYTWPYMQDFTIKK